MFSARLPVKGWQPSTPRHPRRMPVASSWSVHVLAVVVAATASAGEDALPTVPWGTLELKADAVHLVVATWPADGRLVMPRLNNPVGKLHLLADPTVTATLQPNVADWTVTVPKGRPTAAATVVINVLGGAPRVVGVEAPLVEPGADGVLTLSAHLAAPHGKMLRYEPQPHKNTVGFWVDASDWVEWRLRIAKPGAYRVMLLQGCGKDNGGSTATIAVAGHELPWTVVDTGGFQAFVEHEVGRVTIAEAGATTLAIRAVRKAKAAVMDVRQVRLVPAE